jgi:peptide/nickel transport system permease protein
MTTATTDAALLRPEPRAGGRWWRGLLLFVRRKPLGVAGAALLLIIGACALFTSAVARYEPDEYHRADKYHAPSATYWMGTDERGRDTYSRVVYGSRSALQVGAITVALGTTFGLVVGLVSGYAGGKLDFFVQRVVDSFQAFPALFLALAITTALGRDVRNIGIALAVVTWPSAARVIRSGVLAQKQATYIGAARCTGAGLPRILARHILPNVASVFIILATAALAQAILVEASLSFLGVGLNPPKVSWGLMLLEAQDKAVDAPWLVIFPGIAISMAVFGFNLLGDALRDVLDPRQRGR